MPLSRDVGALSTFHMRCIRSILGITQLDIWTSRVTNTEVLAIWNSARQDDLPTRLLRRRTEWLGHLCRMEEERTPRQLVFSALLPTRPACGPRKRWRDALGADVRCLDLGDEEWFDLAQERSTWRGPYSSVPSSGPLPQPRTPCAVCGRSLSKSGMARHKCKEERSKPIADQIGSRKCPACKRWFRSTGGLAVHKCRPDDDRSTGTVADPPLSAPNSVVAVPVPARTQLTLPCCKAHCSACGRCCRSKRGFQLHSCARYT